MRSAPASFSALRPTFILWRHVVREILPPTALGFLLFTFLMLMRFLLQISRLWIQYGAELSTVLWAIVYSLPHIVVLTLPMGVLVGGLLAFGRMSSDFEVVALRALGFSMLRLAPPVLAFSMAMWAINSYLFLVVMPWGNTNLREMQWQIITQRAFSQEFEPRVFNEDFPDLVLYIEDVVDRGQEWRGVFAAETTTDSPTIVRAERARPIIDEAERRTYLELENGTIVASASDPRDVTITRFESQRMLVWSEEEDSVLGDPGKDGRSMTLAELRQAIAERQANDDPAYDFQVEVHKKFALPFACVVLGLISLALGASTQRQTTAAGFAIGTGVILVYYFLAQNGEQRGDVGDIAPWLGMWAANIVLGAAAIVLLLARTRERDLGIVRALLPLWERAQDLTSALTKGRWLPAAATRSRSLSRGSFPRTLDRYVIWNYTAIYALSFLALLAVWVVIDWLDKASYVTLPELIPRYMSYQVFEICSDVIPIAAVVTILATFSLMTKHNEITAALAGGISLYRLILPVLIPALTLTGARYLLQDYVLPTTTRLAEETTEEMHPSGNARVLQREQTWVFSEGQRVFHFADYVESLGEFRGLRIYYLSGTSGGIARMEYADRAVWNPAEGRWEGHDGWRRHFVAADGGELAPNPLEEFRYAVLPFVETPAYFQQTPLQPEEMTILDLREHVQLLRERGYSIDRALVDYNLKIASPFVVLVMSVVGIPFAFRSGRHGALTGVGIAVALVIIYFICFAVFRALGYAGQLPPPLAAWAPHLLFLALAGYQALGLRS